jgi:hypothetical protein
MCPYLPNHSNSMDKFDDSPTKSADLVKKSNDETIELE